MSHRISQFSLANNKVYEDTSFTVGESPCELNVITDLGRPANFGYIIIDGPGSIGIKVMNYETGQYGDQFTLKDGDMVMVNGWNIQKITLVWIANSAYRINLS